MKICRHRLFTVDWVTLINFLFICCTSFTEIAVASDLKNYMSQLSNGQIFDFSPEGPLGKIVESQSSESLPLINDLLAKITSCAEKPNDCTLKSEDFETKLDGNLVRNAHYPHIENDVPNWMLDVPFLKSINSLFVMFPEFRNDKNSIGLILEAAQEEIEIRKRKKTYGEIYLGFEFVDLNKGGRNRYFHMEVTPEVQMQIESQFSESGEVRPHELNSVEKSLLEGGDLTLEEISELRQLREATRILSVNTQYSVTPGGWENNKYKPENAPSEICLIAYCGEQARTMLDFTKRLQKNGLLKHFTVKTVLVRTHLFNNHAAVAIQALSSKKILMVDKWLTDGQSAARVIPLEKWAWWRQGENNSISLSSSTSECPLALETSDHKLSLPRPPPKIRLQMGR